MMPAPAPRSASVLLVLAGIAFALLWVGAHLAWITLSFAGTLMANDSGAHSEAGHLAFIFGMLGGQVLAGAAAIPGGLAFFWRGRRRLLLGLFGGLFVVGALLQAWAFFAFFD